MKLLCDEMLAGLARWLRAAGHDTALAPPGTGDDALLARARAEDRRLLTRDRALAEGGGTDVLLLDGDGLETWATQLRMRLGLDWQAAPFSRCLDCNTPVEAVSEDSVKDGVKDRVDVPAHLPRPLTRCPACDKLYWPGSHVRRMRNRLQAFAAEN